MILQNWINKISDLICNYINMNCSINKKDNIKINYALVAILGETLKLIILIIIFLLVNKVVFFLFSLIILILIRTFSGGLHFKTFNGCLLFSIMLFIITCLAATALPQLPNSCYYIFGFFSVLLIFVNAPCPSFKRPIKNKKRRYHFKIISTLSSVCCLTMLTFFKDNTSFLNCGFFTILLQSVQLAFANKNFYLNIVIKHKERINN